jgi:hypothetical protein
VWSPFSFLESSAPRYVLSLLNQPIADHAFFLRSLYVLIGKKSLFFLLGKLARDYTVRFDEIYRSLLGSSSVNAYTAQYIKEGLTG